MDAAQARKIAEKPRQPNDGKVIVGITLDIRKRAKSGKFNHTYYGTVTQVVKDHFTNKGFVLTDVSAVNDPATTFSW